MNLTSKMKIAVIWEKNTTCFNNIINSIDPDIVFQSTKVATNSKIVDLLRENQPDNSYIILITDIHDLTILKNVNQFTDQIILVSEKWSFPEDFSEISGLNIILGTDNLGYIRKHELEKVIQKFQNKNIFGLSYYIDQPLIDKQIAIPKATERRSAIEELIVDAESVGISGRTLLNLEACINEIISNAFYHQKKISDFANTPEKKMHLRELQNELLTKQSKIPSFLLVQLKWAMNNSYFGFSVEDSFGRIVKSKCLGPLFRRLCKKRGIFTKSNVGMGLFLAHRALDNLIYNVAAGRRTEFVGLIQHDLKKRDRLKKYSSKSLMFYYYNNK